MVCSNQLNICQVTSKTVCGSFTSLDAMGPVKNSLPHIEQSNVTCLTPGSQVLKLDQLM